MDPTAVRELLGLQEIMVVVDKRIVAMMMIFLLVVLVVLVAQMLGEEMVELEDVVEMLLVRTEEVGGVTELLVPPPMWLAGLEGHHQARLVRIIIQVEKTMGMPQTIMQ
jgi:energy-coupling factor transporter transmembrane protein EcfT